LNEIAAVALPSINEDKFVETVQPKESKEVITINAKSSDTEKSFTAVEQMPVYPGGEEELMKFIIGNLRYPSEAKKAGIEGRVIIRFVVSKNGDITNVEVLRGLDPSCDQEAVRVAKLMPKWTPGKQNGKNVNVYFTIPIVFRLADSKVKIESKDSKGLDEVVVVGYGATDKDTPVTTADVMPQYPGGEQALMKYILENLKYPSSAKEKGIEGRVIIRFVINKTGEVTNVEVLRGLYPDCDNEGLRVVRGMPNWTPGKQDGKNVPVYFTLPIVYRLKKDGNKDINKAITEGVQIRNNDGTEPYIIVNGKEFKGKMSDINPNDIEAIDILKEISAKELYGEKGANGVILITLKKSTFKPIPVDSIIVK